MSASADDDVAAEARSRRAMGLAFGWGLLTLALLWWFARSFAF
jgi:hypothetical protein